MIEFTDSHNDRLTKDSSALEAAFSNTRSTARDDAQRDLEAWVRLAAKYDKEDSQDDGQESFLDDFLIISFTALFAIGLLCGLGMAAITSYRLIAEGIGGPAAVGLLVLFTGIGIAAVRFARLRQMGDVHG